MKKLLTYTAIIFISMNAKAQFYGKMRIGMNATNPAPIISPAISFDAHGFSLSPELIIFAAQDQAKSMGMKLSYIYSISEAVKVEAGYGYFYDLYSTDSYDRDKNGFSNDYFAALHYKQWFGEFEYKAKQVVLSVGVKGLLSNIK